MKTVMNVLPQVCCQQLPLNWGRHYRQEVGIHVDFFKKSRLFRLQSWLLVIWLSLPLSLVSFSQPPPNITYIEQGEITEGGVHVGNWRSLDSRYPALTIKTTAKVTIVNSILVGAGNLIVTADGLINADVTVINCYGYGLTPTEPDKYKRFVSVGDIKNLRVANNYLESTGGIYALKFTGNGSSSQTIKILNNRARNMMGNQKANGKMMFTLFAQLDKVKNIKLAEIAWNEVINEPGKSSVDDNINIFNSNGFDANNPIQIHNNYIQGAYEYPFHKDSTFTGGGIMAGDGAGDPPLPSTPTYYTANVEAHHNQVVGTINHGFSIVGGKNINIYNNTAINSGELANGEKFTKNNVGISLQNTKNHPASVYSNNHAYDNRVGWVSNVPGVNGIANVYVSNCSTCSENNNTKLSLPIPRQMEQDEYIEWIDKLGDNGDNNVSIGPKSRFEAEDPAIYKVVNDVDGDVPSIKSCATTILSGGQALPLSDVGDKVRLTFSVAKAGTYNLHVRLRSGWGNPPTVYPTIYWPGGYGFLVNGNDQPFDSNVSNVLYSSCQGGSYWGTASTTPITLKAGANTLDITAGIANVMVDYVDVIRTRFEAEDPTVYFVLNDVDGDVSNIKSCSTPPGILSGDKALPLTDVGDKVRLTFSVAQTGTYNLNVRLRSGWGSSPQIYWTPTSGYGLAVDNATPTFDSNVSNVLYSSSCQGGSYWGTASTQSPITLKAGIHVLDIAAKTANVMVDYLDVQAVSVSGRLSAEPTLQEALSNITLFPNPFEDKLTVNLGEKASGTYQVGLIDALGRSYYAREHQVEGNQTQLSLQLPAKMMKPGLYFLQLNNGSQSPKVIKIVKQP